MRELEVLRVESDGEYVVLFDRQSDEQFRIRVDEDLRAAARGNSSELGQVNSPGESALRPREIQARIRAGASVSELAKLAGVSESKIDRYAHPVMLERARAAELARASHPLGMDGPALASLGELVAECLVLRGGVPADARWDAWKTEEGQWMVQVGFREGRSDNHAHWRFHPGSHGGTTEPVDELAVELTDPELARAAARRVRSLEGARPLAPVRAVPAPVEAIRAPVEQRPAEPRHAAPVVEPVEAKTEAPRNSSFTVQPAPPSAPATIQSAKPAPTSDPFPFESVPSPEPEAPAEETKAEPAAVAPAESTPAPAEAESTDDDARKAAAKKGAAKKATAEKREQNGQDKNGGPLDRAPRRNSRRQKPAVPAWEDVLLGVRSHDD